MSETKPRARAHALRPLIASLITSATLRGVARTVRALPRLVTGGRRRIDYFHQVDDPYSVLAVQVLPRLAERYGAAITVHVVGAPDDAAAPERARLADWSRRDALRLAQAHGLALPGGSATPSPEAIATAQAMLVEAGPDLHSVAKRAVALYGALVAGDRPGDGPRPAPAAIAAATALRARLGHYLGAMVHYEGEWYWGLDRLPHLERRLGAAPGGTVVRQFEAGAGPAADAQGVTLDFFLSFRSPYTYIAAARVRALAARFNATLRLRPVLPMVLRGLPVPGAKRLYITHDTKREAERLGLPFGRIADPVPHGVPRGLAVLHRAIPAGKGPDFVESFLAGVFAEGVDAATDAGIHKLAGRVGLDPGFVAEAEADPAWRAACEANRTELFALGLWGVPCFRVGDRPPIWGQDRLWAVEQELLDHAAARGRSAA